MPGPPSSGARTAFADVSPAVPASDPGCWVFEPEAPWHGFPGLSEGQCMPDPYRGNPDLPRGLCDG